MTDTLPQTFHAFVTNSPPTINVHVWPPMETEVILTRDDTSDRFTFRTNRNGLGWYPDPAEVAAGRQHLLSIDTPTTFTVIVAVSDPQRGPAVLHVEPGGKGIAPQHLRWLKRTALALVGIVVLIMVLSNVVSGWRDALLLEPGNDYLGHAEDWVHARTLRAQQHLSVAQIAHLRVVRAMRLTLRAAFWAIFLSFLGSSVVVLWDAGIRTFAHARRALFALLRGQERIRGRRRGLR